MLQLDLKVGDTMNTNDTINNVLRGVESVVILPNPDDYIKLIYTFNHDEKLVTVMRYIFEEFKELRVLDYKETMNKLMRGELGERV